MSDSTPAPASPEGPKTVGGDASSPGPATVPPAAPSRVQRTTEAARTRQQELVDSLARRRGGRFVLSLGFSWFERDKQIAGGVLGGGLAYRFFFWALALAVLASAGFGFASRAGADVEAAAVAVLGDAFADEVSQAASQAEGGRWWLLFVGLWLTIWFSWGLLRALRLVHSAAWRVVPPPLRHPERGMAAVLAVPVVFLLLTGLAGWMRESVGALPGAFATILAGVGFAVLWLWISWRLPSRDVPWTAFIPGAALLGVGFEALHVFTVYFLARKLESASQLYGTLGLATTALFYFFLIGRGVIWAAELNAVAWELTRPVDVPDEEEAAAARSQSPG